MIALWGMLLLVGPAEAACSWTILTNGNSADANQVLNDLNCLAPLANPSFTGNVGIGTTSPSNLLTVGSQSGQAANDQQTAEIRGMRVQISALQRKAGVQTARN